MVAPQSVGAGLHQFHHQGAIFDAVNSDDGGMVQRGEDLGFACETGEAVGIGGEKPPAVL